MDKLTRAERSQNMRLIRSKDTAPELLVRGLLSRLGYRYRLHRLGLPGKPDVVFVGKKKAIFVHGCFWHQHGSSVCKIVRMPKSNREYWRTKLRKNVRRDSANRLRLRKLGWRSIIVWECQAKKIEKQAGRLTRFLNR